MGIFLGSYMVSPVDMVQPSPFYDWKYTNMTNGTKLLELYMRKDPDVTVINSNTIINTSCFQNDFYTVNLDLNNVPYKFDNMSNAFCNCYNLVSVTNINKNVMNMEGMFIGCNKLTNAIEIPDTITSISNTFKGCKNLKKIYPLPNSIINMSNAFCECWNLVNAPEVPNSVVDMSNTFRTCFNLSNVLSLSNSVTNMVNTFGSCQNLVNVPEIPNSVTNMVGTFSGCSKLENSPIIPDNVTNMYSTFSGCSKLTGNIYIYSNKIKQAQACFQQTSITKNVYIPFRYNVSEDMYAWYDSNAFYENYPEILYTKTESPLANTEGQVFYENGTSFTKSNIITTSANNYINFGSWSLRYSRNPMYDVINDANTLTYYLFNQYYGSGQNGVTLYDINTLINIDDWRYDTLENGTRLLYNYTGSEIDIVVPLLKTVLNNYNSNDITNAPFYGRSDINSVNLKEVAFINNDMSHAFENCSSIKEVSFINQNVINIVSTFDGCNELEVAPTIPNSISDLTRTFANTNITNMPEIPSSVTNMFETFINCHSLVNVKTIKNGVTNISGIFYGCNNIETIKTLPNTITDISRAFDGCVNLSGDIIITSSNISNITDCFANTTSDKNVYIPLLDENNNETLTYQTFNASGYSTETRSADGVLLKDIQEANIVPTEFGSRIDNKATVVGVLQDHEGNDYVLAVVDAAYRSGSEAYSTLKWSLQNIDTPLQDITDLTLAETDAHSGKYNTDLILSTYTATDYPAFNFARNACSVTIGSNTYYSVLPSLRELILLYNNKDLLDQYDPTLSEYSERSLSNWAFGERYAWTSTEYSYYEAWYISYVGMIMNRSKSMNGNGVCPVICIPLS